jgi:hypothetical protein
MQFVVIGYDGKDQDAPKRRLEVREEHLNNADAMRKEKKLLYAAAILDENENMIGSIMTVDFSSRKDLDNWLENEAYVKNDVWQDIVVHPCKIPPMFLG